MVNKLRNEQINALASTTKQGTIDSTQFIRLRDTALSVKEEGAVGDGIVDDSSNLLKISTITSNANYPVGTYKIGTTVVLGASDFVHHFAIGAILHVTAGVTLTIEGVIDAASGQQIFQMDSGATVLTPNITRTYPGWFGGIADGVTDCTIPFNNAAISLSNGGEIFIPFGNHKVSSFIDSGSKTIIRPRDNVNFTGAGYGSVIKIANGLSSSGDWSLFKAFDVNGTLNNVKFSNFRVDCSGNPSTSAGDFNFGLSLIVFHIRRGADVHFNNVWIEHHMGANPVILGGDASGGNALFERGSITNCTFTDCGNDTGGYLQDHSTIYSVGSDIRIINNFFDSQAIAQSFITVTADTTTNFFTATAHGLLNGQVVRMANAGGSRPEPFNTRFGASPPEGYKESFVVINKTSNTFQLALLSSPDSPIDITTTGTGTNYVYIPSVRYHGASIETHFTNGVVSNNTTSGYLTFCNIGADTLNVRGLILSSNTFNLCNIGFSLYQQHGFLAKRILISNNTGTITSNGIDAQCGIVSGDPGAGVLATEGLDQLSINNNHFNLEVNGNVPSTGGHGCFITHNILSGNVIGNSFTGFPTSGLFFQPGVPAANRILHDLNIENNSVIDCGTVGTPIAISTSDNDIIRRLKVSDNHISAPSGGTYSYAIQIVSAGDGVILRNNDITSYVTAPELIQKTTGGSPSTTLTNVQWQRISFGTSFETVGFNGVNGSIKTQDLDIVSSITGEFLIPSEVVVTDASKKLSSIPYAIVASPNAIVRMDNNSTITGGAIIGSGLFDTSSAGPMSIGTSSATSITLGKSGVDVIIPGLTASQIVITNGSKHLSNLSLSASQVAATDGSSVLTGIGYSQAASPFKLVQMDTNSTITGGAFQGSGYFDVTNPGTMQVGANIATRVDLSRLGVNIAMCGTDVTFGSGTGVIGLRAASSAPTGNPTNGGLIYTDLNGKVYLHTTSGSTIISEKSITFDASGIGLSISQSDTSAVSTGATLTIQAQTSTHSSSTGGNLSLAPGTGTSVNGVINLFGGAGSGSGGYIISIANCTTAPTTNPTGGGILYVEGGALKYRGSSGTVNVLSPA